MSHHRHSTMRQRFARLPLPDKLAVVALSLGGILRLALAWAGRAATDPAAVATGLAARHIAQGAGFFLLGDGPYCMGPLEPAVGGMLYMVLGESGFVAGLAPALFAFAALWALWRWGRAATGEWGGLLALLAGLSGPPGMFTLQAVPLGGWMAALAFECLVLAQASRMAKDIRDEWEPSPNAYAGLGLLAGIGVWTTRLAVPAALVAAWMLSRAMKGRWNKHWKGILAATAGLVPGMAAWLCGLAGIGREGTAATMPGGGNRFAGWMDGYLRSGGGSPAAQAMMGLLLLLACTGFCCVVAAAVRHRHRHHPARSAAAALAILYPLWLALAGVPGGDAGRPWVLWLPAAAILGAVACTVPKGLWVRRCATVLLLGTVAWQTAWDGALLCRMAAASSHRVAEWNAMAAALAGRDASTLVAPVGDYGLNLFAGKALAVADGSPDRDPAILRRVELAPSPVWTADFPGLADWVSIHGARHSDFTAAGRRFFADIQAPLPNLREWPAPPNRIPGPGPAAVLADGHLDSWLEGQGGSLAIEWTFPSPASPAALQLLFDDRGNPERFVPPGHARVELLRDGTWESHDLPLPALDTSLGRPYPPSALHSRDLPLPAPLRPAEALRLTIFDRPGDHSGLLPWRLSEVALFVEAEDGTQDSDDALLDSLIGDGTLAALRDRLADLPSDVRVFAPRRLSGLLAASGTIAPSRLPALPLPATAPQTGAAPGTSPGLVPDGLTSCLCVESRFADATRIALGAADRPAETDTCGPWTLFLLPPSDPEKRLPGLCLRWAGDSPVADLDFPAVDRLTDIILGKLQGQKTKQNEWLRSQLETPADAPPLPGSGGRSAATIRWNEEPVADDPEALPASVTAVPDTLALDPKEERKVLLFIRQLSLVRPQSLAVLPEEIVYQAGGSDLLGLRARSGIQPARPIDTVFRDGLVLQGIDAFPSDAVPGSRIALTLYWQASGSARDLPDSTFVRVRAPDGRTLAQTAWTGPANAAGYADFAIPLQECQTETVAIDLPADLPSGPLQILVGRLCGDRPVPVKSSRGTVLPDASAAMLDDLLRVSPR